MTNANAPREFKFQIFREPDGFAALWDMDFNGMIEPKKYHVIEYAAYMLANAAAAKFILERDEWKNKKLNAVRQDLIAEINRLNEEAKYYKEIEQLVGKEAKETSDLRIKLDKAVAALRECAQYCENWTMMATLKKSDRCHCPAHHFLRELGEGEGEK